LPSFSSFIGRILPEHQGNDKKVIKTEFIIQSLIIDFFHLFFILFLFLIYIYIYIYIHFMHNNLPFSVLISFIRFHEFTLPSHSPSLIHLTLTFKFFLSLSPILFTLEKLHKECVFIHTLHHTLKVAGSVFYSLTAHSLLCMTRRTVWKKIKNKNKNCVDWNHHVKWNKKRINYFLKCNFIKIYNFIRRKISIIFFLKRLANSLVE
jgi:hypothetical protein